MELIEVGKIVNTHGLKGEVKVAVWMDSADDFEVLTYVYARMRNEDVKLTVGGIKYQKNNLIVKFAEITDIDAAQMYKNAVLYAERDMVPIAEDAYFIADIIGLDVVNVETGEKIGTVEDVFNTGSSDIYDIKREGKKNLLIPAIDDVIKETDIDGGKLLIYMMEGLDDEV